MFGNFDFDSTVGNADTFFPMYRQYMQAVGGTNASIAKVVHSFALPFNNPTAHNSAAALFEREMNKHVRYWTEEVEESKRIPKKDLKLKGGNPFSAAYRKIKGAMELGGDLSKLTTVAQCEEFVRNTNKENREQAQGGAITAEQRAIMIAEGKDPDTPEGREELKRRVDELMGKLAPDDKKGKKDGSSEGGMKLDDLELEFITVFRQYKDAYKDVEATKWIQTSIDKLKNAVQANARMIAAQAGLTKDDESKAA